MNEQSNQNEEATPKSPEMSESVRRRYVELREKRFMFTHLIDGILTGIYQPMSGEQLKRIAEQRYFSFEPLIQLGPQQEILLQKYVVDNLAESLNRTTIRELTQTMYVGADADAMEERDIVTNALGMELIKGTPRMLTPEDKLQLFDIDFYCHQRNGQRSGKYFTSYSNGFAAYGNRTLNDIGFADERWRELTERAKASTGTSRLRILDIGCGVGLALRDMKRLDPEAQVFGLSAEQEPAQFDGADGMYYLSAERVPADFAGRFDMILSNVSFRYHLFPHLSLRNVVLALSRGGHAELGFSFDRVPSGQPYRSYFKEQVPEAAEQGELYDISYLATRELVAREFSRLEQLERAGALKLTVSQHFRRNGNQGWLVIDKLGDVTPEEYLKPQ